MTVRPSALVTVMAAVASRGCRARLAQVELHAVAVELAVVVGQHGHRPGRRLRHPPVDRRVPPERRDHVAAVAATGHVDVPVTGEPGRPDHEGAVRRLLDGHGDHPGALGHAFAEGGGELPAGAVEGERDLGGVAGVVELRRAVRRRRSRCRGSRSTARARPDRSSSWSTTGVTSPGWKPPDSPEDALVACPHPVRPRARSHDATAVHLMARVWLATGHVETDVVDIVTVSVPAPRVERWVANFETRHGATTYAVTGGALEGTAEDGSAFAARLPFGTAYDGPADATSLAGAATAPRHWGVLLVRKGGFAVARMAAAEIAEHKIGQRHVQGRTKAGGQSQQRFARRRGNQARQAYEAAADHAARILRAGSRGDRRRPRRRRRGAGRPAAARAHGRRAVAARTRPAPGRAGPGDRRRDEPARRGAERLITPGARRTPAARG